MLIRFLAVSMNKMDIPLAELTNRLVKMHSGKDFFIACSYHSEMSHPSLFFCGW